MSIEFGKIVSSNNGDFCIAQPFETSEGNFFSSGPSQEKEKIKQGKQENSTPGVRMNDFDSNILENNAYQSIEDEMFKIEHKIEILEANLSKLNSEIDALENLNYDIQVPYLKERRQKILQELAELNEKYSHMGISAKISGQIVSAVNFTSNKRNSIFSKAGDFLSKKVLTKISKKFSYSQSIKEALDKLSEISLSVDELVKLQAPYGETINRYEKLTAYLNKINTIQVQIATKKN